ncbi:MAG: choline kinase, partial [Planctomycetes bacterium]|nr:choline kinase [Planctomycetota bacterium]
MDADPADPHVARVATLPCWQAEVTIAPLGGGITNRNFVVVDGESRYVTRICEELPHLGIERRNEVVCQKAAHQLG